MFEKSFPKFLLGGGESGDLIRSIDWTKTEIGEPETWPISLKTSVKMLLDCKLPMHISWGKNLIQFYNDAYRPILGNKHPKAMGISIWETWTEIRPTIEPMFEDVLRGNSIGFDNYKLTIDRYGYPEDCYFNFSYSPIPNDLGESFGILVTFAETTERILTEEKLRMALIERDKSLETLETINKVGQRLTAELDLEKLVQQVTDDATRLTDAQFGAFFYNTIDENGKSLLLNVVSGVAKEEFAKFPNPRATAIFQPTFVGAGTLRSGNITKDPRYGQNAPYKGLPPGHLPVRSYLAVSVISKTGEVIGGLFFGHEKENIFTEHAEKIAEGLASQAAVAMDNARLYGKIQESVRARDEFLSIASHELKTPLTSLKLQAQIQMRFVSRSNPEAYSIENVDEFVSLVDKQTNRLTRLIDDMLDVSRIRSGRLDIKKESVNLSRLTVEVVHRLRDLFLNSSYETPELNMVNDAVVFCDPLRIEQVLVNLLTNAVRYGNGNPIKITTEIHACNVRVIVQDGGIGIKKEDVQKIFDRFERSVNANEVSGLGLGLFITKQIVAAHGGNIWVESELGIGSKFIVDFPKSEETAKAER